MLNTKNVTYRQVYVICRYISLFHDISNTDVTYNIVSCKSVRFSCPSHPTVSPINLLTEIALPKNPKNIPATITAK